MTQPRTIGRYEVLERIGQGGMGVLYRARDSVLDRDVAIKMMLVDFAAEPGARERFEREARAIARLAHRNIVTIHELGDLGGMPYIVMELLGGSDLAALMLRQPPLALDDKLDIVIELCAGLAFAHERGIVHRDMKPSNVRVLPDGTVKLLDFGIAKMAVASTTHRGTMMGTASYMAPEQISDAAIDGRADIFSIGVLLYELLSGTKPFAGESPAAVIYQILHTEPPPIRSLAADLPAPLADVVARALQKNPDQRYGRASEMAADLQIVRSLLLPPPAPMSPTPTVVSRAARSAGAATPTPPQMPALTPIGAPARDDVPTIRHAPPLADRPIGPARGSSPSSSEPAGEIELDLRPHRVGDTASTAPAVPAGRERSGARWWIAALLTIGVGAAAGYVVMSRQPSDVGRVSGPAGQSDIGRVLRPAGAGKPAEPSGDTPAPAPDVEASRPTTASSAADTPAPSLAPPAPIPSPGTLRIASQPPGARVILDGRDSGRTTPATIERDGDGPKTLRLTLPGYRALEASLEGADWTAGARAFTLTPELPTATVEVSGSYAFEILQGTRPVSGAASAHVLKLPAGRLTLRLHSREHFLNLSVPLELRGGERRAIAVPALGVVSIFAALETCNITIDGERVGYPPIARRPIVAGPHRVVLRCPDGSEEVRRVEVPADAPVTVTFARRD